MVKHGLVRIMIVYPVSPNSSKKAMIYLIDCVGGFSSLPQVQGKYCLATVFDARQYSAQQM
jgi:hypothetical protein